MVNEAFDVSIEALNGQNSLLTDYAGTIYFENVNGPSLDVVLPSFGDNGYKFTLADE
jgi:hypothetical protein